MKTPFILAVSLLMTLTAPAAVLETQWTGAGTTSDWTNLDNWTFGVPNNTETNVYNATIDYDPAFVYTTPIVGAPVTVNDLSLPEGGINFYSDFTVQGATTLGAGFTDYDSPKSSLYLYWGQVDLGTVAAFAGGTLDRGSFSLYGDSAVLEWRNAAVSAIGGDASIYLAGQGSAILDSVTNADALAGLADVRGSFGISDRTFATTGGLSVTGSLSARAYNADAAITVHGAMGTQAGDVLTAGYFNVNAENGHAATIAWDGAQIQTIGSGAGISLSGSGADILDRASGTSALWRRLR